MLLVAVIYPITFEWYAGQLADPLSHLSFLLAFIFLETGNFPLLLTALLIGSLAKETVLALAVFYVLFRRREKHYWIEATLLCLVAGVTIVGVRLLVSRGNFHFSQISNVPPDFFVLNWHDYKWRHLFVITACAYVPFLVLAWKQGPGLLKRLVLFLFPVLFVSSLFFSWLVETRNYMPVVFVLAVISARYLVQVFASSGDMLSRPPL